MAKISIIVPIYNVEKYIARCIESILAQTFCDFELILINDGSLDGSGDICNKYLKKDKRIKYFYNVNQGVSYTRNFGIEIAKGEFCMFVDPDDYLDIDALEYLYTLAKSSNADIIAYKMKTYKNNVLKSKIVEDEIIEIYEDEKIIKEYIENTTFLYSVCNKLYLRKLLNDIRFSVDINYAEDALFNYYTLGKAKKVVLSNLQKYNYWINENSTVTLVTRKRLDILKAQKKIYHYLNLNYSGYSGKIVNQYINSSISIVIDIVNEKNILKKYYLLRELKKLVRRDRTILKDKSIVSLKNKVLFFILNISPFIVAILYKLRFSIKEVR
ncbi:glycosyltransferase family 2 protein [Clostridium perfringens]|uniref:glycosyltransferase family 2 protein n=1 Tax=Clostridium perfringens TaxID=1502 RepID=UPI00115C7D77|nr:glycosyltransferase family 2 protein [Clostridium perfringens]MDH5073467.1 putative glycosyltransferase EpsJ [Clostridium perfringens]MDK0912624.1 glycosyltransferase family 2 protein [Clostridium perfringens]MDK0950200.1 glycosyltransferase family 2 protein [Clostridium perfringens]MDM0851226.1 glycosyltransferase family 2 protein [Clostridium perfringens]MDM0854151.1 glycosyltransferase family 2 protein [Clostridium perfringens]